MIRQAVILAAGNGTRMKKDGADQKFNSTPKPLLEINGVPMIEHKIKRLMRNGVRVCVVINPKYEEMFREKLSAYDIDYCYQSEPLGTADAVYCAREFATDELFLVLMGDDIVEYDAEIVLNSESPAVFGYEIPDVTGYGVVVADQDGHVKEIVEKQRSGRGIANTGVYIMSRNFFNYYEEVKAMATGKEVYLTDAPKALSAHEVRFRLMMLSKWHGINTPDDLLRAHDILV